MNLVLDCSAAIRILLRQEPCELLETAVSQADVVWAPDLVICESANALWKYHVHSGLAASICETALSKLPQLIEKIVPSQELYEDAFRLSCGERYPVYDMFYLALARREGAALLSVDGPLKKRAGSHGILTI